MSTYLEIAVNVAQVTGVFHYHLPLRLEGQVEVGCLVIVPFGRQQAQGVVLRFIDTPAVPHTRPVTELLDPQPVLTPVQLELARYLSSATLASLAECIDLMVPQGLGQQAEVEYALVESAMLEVGSGSGSLTEIQGKLLKLLRARGPLRTGQIERALPHVEWRPSIQSLARRGLVVARSRLPMPTVRAKFVRSVQLAVPPQVAFDRLAQTPRLAGATLQRRQAMLRFLSQEGEAVDVSWVYAESGGALADLQRMAEMGLVVLGETEAWRDPLQSLDAQPLDPPVLTGDQVAVWAQVQAWLGQAEAGSPVPPMLLHGVTGSGKTEIYLRAVEEVLEQGRQAIVLVPEISLTPQTVRRFAGRFPGQVGVFHSRLSVGERYDTWRRARTGGLGVVIGPRSALFIPFPKLGLIVVDESHDDSYYQSENPPHYHAREAAIAYARLAQAACLLGTATPDIVSGYRCQTNQWRYLRLPSRIMAHRQVVQAHVERLGLPARYRPLEAAAESIDLPPVKLVDMRQELKEGNRSLFSHDLISALSQTLERHEQAILFLNRRGAATHVFCRDCGFVVKCPRCDIPLTYHRGGVELDDHLPAGLICHYCGYRRKMPARCPSCNSDRIRQYGAGTERVEAELEAHFPQARSLLWDATTTQKKGAHELILSHFAAHRADVLIGTQMLAKGLDLPLVTLVGVVLADVGLNLPDYRAPERTFQTLTQVAGRAGRGPLGGQAILQTFQPENYAIQAAAQHDYRSFYIKEMEYRLRLGYPPYSNLVRLEYRHLNPDRAEAVAQELAGKIDAWLEMGDRGATERIGPAPCFFARLGGYYRWQIILRGPDPASLLLEKPLADWRVEVNPPSLL